MVCKQSKKCGIFTESSFTCMVANGGPRNEFGNAYCGKLRELEA